jgi:hypothetical protein
VVVFDVWIDHPVAWIARLVGNTVGLQPATSWDDDKLERERERCITCNCVLADINLKGGMIEVFCSLDCDHPIIFFLLQANFFLLFFSIDFAVV